MIAQCSIHKQFLINQLNNSICPTNPCLPKELCEIIKSYCFYDSKTYELLCNICRFKIDICDIINEHVINNEQLFIDSFYDEEYNDIDDDYATIIYTIQRYNPIIHHFYFSTNNIINICLKCGNYISCKTPTIPNYIRCHCTHL